MRTIPPDELKFNKLRRQYFEKFGIGYGQSFGEPKSLSEHNKIMEEALRTGIPAEEPQYPENIIA